MQKIVKLMLILINVELVYQIMVFIRIIKLVLQTVFLYQHKIVKFHKIIIHSIVLNVINFIILIKVNVLLIKLIFQTV